MPHNRNKNRLRPINYFEVYDPRTRTYVGNLVDMSTAGLRVLSARPMDPGETRELQIRLPREIMGVYEITVTAECRWCKECTSPLLAGTFGVGLQVRNLSAATRDQIEAFIKSSYFHDWRELPQYAAIYAETSLSS